MKTHKSSNFTHNASMYLLIALITIYKTEKGTYFITSFNCPLRDFGNSLLSCICQAFLKIEKMQKGKLVNAKKILLQ